MKMRHATRDSRHERNTASPMFSACSRKRGATTQVLPDLRKTARLRLPASRHLRASYRFRKLFRLKNPKEVVNCLSKQNTARTPPGRALFIIRAYLEFYSSLLRRAVSATSSHPPPDLGGITRSPPACLSFVVLVFHIFLWWLLYIIPALEGKFSARA